MTFPRPILGQIFHYLETQSDVDEQVVHVRESCVSFPNLRGSFSPDFTVTAYVAQSHTQVSYSQHSIQDCKYLVCKQPLPQFVPMLTITHSTCLRLDFPRNRPSGEDLSTRN